MLISHVYLHSYSFFLEKRKFRIMIYIPLSISIASILTHEQTKVEYPNQKVSVSKDNSDVILYNGADCFSRLSLTRYLSSNLRHLHTYLYNIFFIRIDQESQFVSKVFHSFITCLCILYHDFAWLGFFDVFLNFLKCLFHCV